MRNDEIKLTISAEDKLSFESAKAKIAAFSSSLGTLEAQTRTFAGRMQQHWMGITAAIAAVSASLYSVLGVIKKYTAEGDNLYKLSQKVGISTANLSGLKHAADMGGTSIEAFAKSTRFFAKALVGMNEEGEDTTRILKEMGVTAKDPYEAFLQVADAVAKLEDGTVKQVAMNKLFGKSSMELIPMMNQGAEGLRQMAAEAGALGKVFETDAAKAAETFNDNLTRLKKNAEGLAHSVLNVAIPAINQLFAAFGKGDKKSNLEYQIESLNREIKMREGGLFGLFKPREGSLTAARIEEAKRQREELQKTLETMNKPVTKDDNLGKRLEKALGTASKLGDEWEKTKAKLQADIDMRNLDEHEKKLVNMRLEYDALIAKFGKKPEIKQWFEEMTEKIKSEKAEAEFNKVRDAAIKAYEEREQLEEKLTGIIGTETQKREIDYAKHKRELTDLAFASAKDMEDLEKKLTQVSLAEQALREQDRIKNMQQERKDYAETIELYIQGYEEATSLVREFGETELEYLKRTIIAKEKNIDVLKEFAADLEDAGMTGDAVYKKIIALVAELEREQRRLNATFSEGVDYALREYEQSLSNAFEQGAQLARQTASEVEDALVTMFDNPKKALNDLFAYFVMTLKRMAAQALAQTITIPISGVLTGVFGQASMAGAAGLAGLGGIGLGGLLGGLFGGTEAQMGGFLGAGLASFVPSIGTAILTPIVSAFGTLSATIGNVIVPVIGGLIGGLLGSIVGLFKKKKYPEMFLEFQAGKDAGGYSVGKHWTGGGLDVEGGLVGFGYKNVGDWSKAEQQILQMFADVRKNTMQSLEALGLDISGFFKDWKKWFPDLSGKTAEEIQQMLKDALGEYLSFAAGIDFSQWQKAGEDLIDTVNRIISTWQAFPKVLESFDDFIGAVEGSYDAIAKWKDDLLSAEENIKKLQKAMEAATDPTDALEYAQQLKQAIYEKYIAEKQLIEGLAASIHQLETELINFRVSIQSKIAGITGDFSGLMSSLWRGVSLSLEKMNEATTALGKLHYLKQAVDYFDQWVAANVQAIQAKYAAEQAAINAQISALNAQKNVINEQLSNLREQLALTRMWSNLLNSVKKQILDMMTTTQSPRDVFERMNYLKTEMDRVRGLWAGATGEDRAKYASELQALIQQYMGLAAEAFQRPSPEYQAIYNDMLGWLEQIKVDAEAYAIDEASILREIESLEAQSLAIDRQMQALQEQSLRLQEQMQAEIQAFQMSMVQHYEWAETEGVRLYEEAIKDMKDKLASIIGDKTVEEYLADLQLAAVTELVTIRDLLTQIAKKFEVPGFAAGGYVANKTLAWVGEREPEYIIPASQMTQGRSITINVPVTVNGGNGSAGDIATATAKAIRKELKNMLKYDNTIRHLVKA